MRNTPISPKMLQRIQSLWFLLGFQAAIVTIVTIVLARAVIQRTPAASVSVEITRSLWLFFGFIGMATFVLILPGSLIVRKLAKKSRHEIPVHPKVWIPLLRNTIVSAVLGLPVGLLCSSPIYVLARSNLKKAKSQIASYNNMQKQGRPISEKLPAIRPAAAGRQSLPR